MVIWNIGWGLPLFFKDGFCRLIFIAKNKTKPKNQRRDWNLWLAVAGGGAASKKNPPEKKKKKKRKKPKRVKGKAIWVHSKENSKKVEKY